jgi:hypothetical protein
MTGECGVMHMGAESFESQILSVARRLKHLERECPVLLVPGHLPLWGNFYGAAHGVISDDIYEAAREARGAAVLMHNHTHSGPPSADDFWAAYELDCAAIHVIMADGEMYSVFRDPTLPWAKMAEIAEALAASAAVMAMRVVAEKSAGPDSLAQRRAGNLVLRKVLGRALPSAQRMLLPA